MISLLNKIPAHYPKPWVVGILLWCAGLPAMGVAALCSLAGWEIGYFIAFGVLFLVVISFMACVAWFIVETVTGRVTPWRR